MRKKYSTDKFRPFWIEIGTEEEFAYLCDVISDTLGGVEKERMPIAKGFYKLLTEE